MESSDDKTLIYDLYKIFNNGKNKEIFPHVRKDAFERKFREGQVIYEIDEKGKTFGLITWMQYKNNGCNQVADKGDIQLCQIAVKPSLHGKGIGTKLFKRLEKLSKDMGALKIGLSVRKSNVSACRFYEKMGMVITGEKVWKEKGHPLQGVVFQKVLLGVKGLESNQVKKKITQTTLYKHHDNSRYNRMTVTSFREEANINGYYILEAVNSKGIPCTILYDEKNDRISYCSKGSYKCLDNKKCLTRKLGLKVFVHNVKLNLENGSWLEAINRSSNKDRESFYKEFKAHLKSIDYNEYKKIDDKIKHNH